MLSCGFCRSADHWRIIKESEKIDKYLDLAGELKKLWNMRVAEILIEVGALGTVPKRELEVLESKRKIETIQMTELLRTHSISRYIVLSVSSYLSVYNSSLFMSHLSVYSFLSVCLSVCLFHWVLVWRIEVLVTKYQTVLQRVLIAFANNFLFNKKWSNIKLNLPAPSLSPFSLSLSLSVFFILSYPQLSLFLSLSLSLPFFLSFYLSSLSFSMIS